VVTRNIVSTGDFVLDERKKRINPPSSVLYVNRLPNSTTEDELKETFQGCINAKVIADPITGESKG